MKKIEEDKGRLPYIRVVVLTSNHGEKKYVWHFDWKVYTVIFKKGCTTTPVAQSTSHEGTKTIRAMLSPKAGWSKEKPNTAWKKKKEASLELYISASSCYASTVPILLYPTGSTFSIQQPVTKHRFRVPRSTEVMLVGTEYKNQCIARIGITCEPGMDKPLASIQSCCS